MRQYNKDQAENVNMRDDLPELKEKVHLVGKKQNGK